MAPSQDSRYSPPPRVFDQSLWGCGMSWTVIWGGVENKTSSCGRSQLPAGQGSLPPTVQPALCQGLLPATLQAAGTPKLLGPPPSPLVALAQRPTPVGLDAQTSIRQRAPVLPPSMASPRVCWWTDSPAEWEAPGLRVCLWLWLGSWPPRQRTAPLPTTHLGQAICGGR